MLRICAAFVLSLAATLAAAGPDGRIRVIDGDTFDVGGTTVRLHGIDAPEADQLCGGQGSPAWRCGAWVSGEVRARYQNRRATCETLDTDRFGRAVARCSVEGQDVGQALVRDGLAFAYRRYSLDYDLDEKGAAVNGRGLHATGIQTPADFRAARSRPPVTDSLASGRPGCAIKGNISRDGKRIYHLPGQRFYDQTGIDTGAGERWFCSEAEARAAGWRRARQ